MGDGTTAQRGRENRPRRGIGSLRLLVWLVPVVLAISAVPLACRAALDLCDFPLCGVNDSCGRPEEWDKRVRACEERRAEDHDATIGRLQWAGGAALLAVFVTVTPCPRSRHEDDADVTNEPS